MSEKVTRGRRPKNKKCEDCGKPFPRVRDLKRHKEKPKLACGSHCNKSFCDFDHLRQH